MSNTDIVNIIKQNETKDKKQLTRYGTGETMKYLSPSFSASSSNNNINDFVVGVASLHIN